MLAFERRVVGALTTSTDEATRARIEAWVASSLRAMPQHLRLGVAAETIALSAWSVLGRTDARSLASALDGSAIGLVRQYARLFRSLVVFAEEELAGSRVPAA